MKIKKKSFEKFQEANKIFSTHLKTFKGIYFCLVSRSAHQIKYILYNKLIIIL